MNVLGLDLSLTATGVATQSGSLHTIAPTSTGALRLLHIRDEIEMMIGGMGYDVVAIEGYSFGSPNQAAHIGELGGVIRVALFERGIPYADIPPTSVKKFATGRGNAKKPDLRMELFKRAGIDEPDDNKVDAAWLRAMAHAHYGEPIVDVPATHRVALDKIKWPDISASARTAA